MTSLAETYQIITFKRKLWIFIEVLYVMHCSRWPLPSVSLAVPAHISVTAQDCLALILPYCACVEVAHISHAAMQLVFGASASEAAFRVLVKD